MNLQAPKHKIKFRLVCGFSFAELGTEQAGAGLWSWEARGHRGSSARSAEAPRMVSGSLTWPRPKQS